MGRITLVEGDITEQQIDGVVNAANEQLLLGSGVAGAIRERGGPSIQADCDAHGPIAVGDVAVTGAGDLAARWILHAAGMPLGGAATEDSVRSALRSVFSKASELGCATLAIPAMGAGVGGLSLQRCAEIGIEEARSAIARYDGLEEIRFVLFGEPAFRVFEMVNDAAKVAAQMEKLKRL